jgi:hypothetical protein
MCSQIFSVYVGKKTEQKVPDCPSNPCTKSIFGKHPSTQLQVSHWASVRDATYKEQSVSPCCGNKALLSWTNQQQEDDHLAQHHEIT